MDFTIPAPLVAEHEELHERLRQATKEGGAVGEAARALAKLMHPHFVKEDRYAMPPLGLLRRLANGEVTQDMQAVLVLSERLKQDLDAMLAEHKGIVAALQQLAEAARQENKPDYVAFSEALRRHAQTEEEVLYPAAILVGEYLKLKLAAA
jgi:hypothetical protein